MQNLRLDLHGNNGWVERGLFLGTWPQMGPRDQTGSAMLLIGWERFTSVIMIMLWFDWMVRLWVWWEVSRRENKGRTLVGVQLPIEIEPRLLQFDRVVTLNSNVPIRLLSRIQTSDFQFHFMLESGWYFWNAKNLRVWNAIVETDVHFATSSKTFLKSFWSIMNDRESFARNHVIVRNPVGSVCHPFCCQTLGSRRSHDRCDIYSKEIGILC